jgi:hypothetical protein
VVVRTLRCMPSATIQLAGNSIVSGFGRKLEATVQAVSVAGSLHADSTSGMPWTAVSGRPKNAYSEALGEVEDGSTFRAYGRITANR